MKSDELPINPQTGKNFLHLAVEYNSVQILAYLLIDQKMNANILSQKPADESTKSNLSDMSILHMAIAKERLDILDLILAHAHNIDINVMS